MQNLLSIIVFVGVALIVSIQAAVKDIPPFFRETPNARSIVDVRADSALNYRLPNNTEPIRYDVTISTNIHKGDLSFSGLVDIRLNVLEDTKSIVLHARDLAINGAIIRNPTTKTATDLSFNYESDREFLTLSPIQSSVKLSKNTQWILSITYNGTLRHDNGGFYVSTYLDEQNKKRFLATTQFESTDARHAFPCYDEPAKRAIFGITINHHASYTAISNMPVKHNISEKDDRVSTTFEDTPKMSSYLVAFIVSDFKWSEGVINNLPQHVYSRPGTEHDQEWALVSGMLIVERLAEYYNVSFSLPKLDQVAVPDFAAGAMENWGLATYREQYLLYNNKKSTVNTQTSIANIIAHEYCHQWFGNLVAVKWWTWLWLKEGFATMFSYKATDQAYPEWDIMQLFHSSDYQGALNVDVGNSARPMTSYVQKPSEIRQKYDSISYAKAGSVLFMWQHALTDKVFQRGVHNYLEKNKYSAAEQDDLFHAIQIAAKEEDYKLQAPVKAMMSSWTMQSGYPLLKVERFYNGSFLVTQEPYFVDEDQKVQKSWFVPINYAVQSNADFRSTEASHYLLNTSSILINASISNEDWLILNKQSTGYYRIDYDERNWNLIIDGLISKPHKIHPRNRAQLLHDAYQFSSTGHLSHNILLNMMTYLKNEGQYAPWSTANSILGTFNHYLSGDKNYAFFKLYVAELVSNIFDKLGVNDIPGEHHFQKYTRSISINLACLAGIKGCLEQTNKKLKEEINEGINIEPNLQAQIYCNGLKRAGDVEFNFVYNKLMNSNNQAERNILIYSLGCAENPSHIRKFIESSINKDTSNTLRVQERTNLLSATYSKSVEGLLACIEFLDQNWVKYGQLTPGFGGTNPLNDDIQRMSNYVTSSEQQSKLLALVKKVKDSSYVKATLEDNVNNQMKHNFDWLKKNRDSLMNWMTEFRTGGSACISASILSVVTAVAVLLLRTF